MNTAYNELNWQNSAGVSRYEMSDALKVDVNVSE